MTEYVCDVCYKSFKFAWQLTKHFISHSNNRQFKCPFGDFDSNYLSQLKKHVAADCPFRATSGKLSFQCKTCSKSYKTAAALREHEHRKHKDRAESFQCDMCKKSFSALINLKNHIYKTHHRQEMKCDDCGKNFTTYAGIKLHAYSVHLRETTPICYNCNKVFPTIAKLNQHMRAHRPPSGEYYCADCQKSFKKMENLNHHQRTTHRMKKYYCDVCSKTFATRAKILAHAASAHICAEFAKRQCIPINEEIMTLRKFAKCSKCRKLFANAEALLAHESQHSAVEFTCQICLRQCANRSTFLRHKSKHAGQQRFDCELCKASYSEASSLKGHIKKKHSFQQMIVDYQCDSCGKVFLQKNGFTEHIKLNHVSSKSRVAEYQYEKSTVEIVNGRLMFKCPNCVQLSTTWHNLQKHIARHEKTMNYFLCHRCDRTFVTKNTLRCHERRHNFRDTFTCFLCVRSFREVGNLRRHVSTTHLGETSELPMRQSNKS